MSEPELVHRTIGSRHVITSPDVPGLFVAEADRETALAVLPAALEMLGRMKRRHAAAAPALKG